MIPENLRTGERMIYSMLPSGISSVKGLHNIRTDLSEQTLRKSIESLCHKGMLQQSQLSLKGADRHRRSLTMYSITPLAVTRYFPKFAKFSPAIAYWLDKHYSSIEENGFCVKPNRNAASWERLLRVIECEQFLSAAGVKTLLDDRPSDEAGVFGRSKENLVSLSELSGLDIHNALYGLRAANTAEPESDGRKTCAATTDTPESSGETQHCEAVKPSEAGGQGRGHSVCAAQDPCSAYSFYRSSEIAPAIKRWEKKDGEDELGCAIKDMNLIRSIAIGFIQSQTRRIAIYRTSASGGTAWVPSAEAAFHSQADAVVRRIPEIKYSVTNDPMEAIIFYKDDRELLGLLKGKSGKKELDTKRLGALGAPYKAVYAIPFNFSGMLMLKQILSDREFLRQNIKAGALWLGPDAEVFENYEAAFPVSHIGEEVFCALPLDIRHLSMLLIDKPDKSGYSILCYSCYRAFLERLLGDVSVYDMELKK